MVERGEAEKGERRGGAGKGRKGEGGRMGREGGWRKEHRGRGEISISVCIRQVTTEINCVL